jgi:transcriptional regulator
MYVPATFEERDPVRLRRFIQLHPLGTLVALTPRGLEANHIPFLMYDDPSPGTLRGHVARANPVWREFVPDVHALVVFHGADSFISPSWYPSKRDTAQVVPTWNYAVVHAYGPLRIIDDTTWLRSHVEALVEEHESTREVPWAVTDAPAEYIETMLKGIVGIEIPIARLIGKWKVSQNRPKHDRAGVVDGLTEEGTEAASDVAALVRETLRETE